MSDRLRRVTYIYRAAIQLFEGDRRMARRWLRRPSRALGGDTPLEYLRTDAGAEEVLDLIGRLEHGVM